MSCTFQETLLVKTTLNPLVKVGMISEEVFKNILAAMKNPPGSHASTSRWLSLQEAQKMLGVSEPTMRKILHDVKEIRFKKLNNRLIRIEEASIIAYLEGKNTSETQDGTADTAEKAGVSHV